MGGGLFGEGLGAFGTNRSLRDRFIIFMVCECCVGLIKKVIEGLYYFY